MNNNKKECYQYIQNQPKVSPSGKPYTLEPYQYRQNQPQVSPSGKQYTIEPFKTKNWEGVL